MKRYLAARAGGASRLIQTALPVIDMIGGYRRCVRRSLDVLIFTCGVLLLVTQPATAVEPTEALVIGPAGSASWSDHLQFQEDHPDFGKAPKVVPFMPMPKRSLDVESVGPVPEAAADTGDESAISPPQAEALIPVTNSFQALPDNNTTIPPDTMGAVGPNHLMTMLNSEVRIQDKAGTNLGTVSLTTWWTSGTGLTGNPFDPRLIFDSLTGRWMAVVDANSWDLTNSRTWLAISNTSDPTGTWQYYSYNMETPGNNSYWHDFPDIGTNTHWIAITNNMFSASGAFGGVAMWVIDKTTLGGPLTAYRFPENFDLTLGTYNGSTLRPALTFDSAENVLYIVDGNMWATAFPTGLIRLSRITGVPPASPSWSVVPDAAGTNPGTGWFLSPEVYDPWNQINASQLGTPTRVQTNDQRIQNAVYRDGHLWFTHSGGRPAGAIDRTVVSWYEVDPLLLNGTGAPTIQSGTLDGGVEAHYFFPSISVNKNNAAALGFSHSNPSIYVEGVATGRQASDPAGAMDPITVIQPGLDSYVKDFSSGRVRWGDYSATAVDPADDTTFWTLQEYAEFDVGTNPSDDRWGTWWAQLSFGGAPTIYDELAVDFGANGLWHYAAGTWTKLTSWNAGAAGVAGWTGGVAADFDANGLYNYNGTSWTKLTGWNAENDLSGWSGGLAADFGANGVHSYDGTGWSKLTAWNAEALAGWSGGLAADFGANGVHSYDGTSWSKLTAWNAEALAGWSGGLAADFGANGLWNYDGTSWSKLTGWNAGSGGMSGWSGGLAGDFDANGVHGYDGTSWSKLTGWNPGSGGLSGWSANLAGDFDANGVHNFDGTSWSKLTSWNAEAMDAVDLN